MQKFALTLCTIAVLAISSPPFADLEDRIFEDPQQDRLVTTSAGDCDVGAAQVAIGFANTNNSLIFDIRGSGAGVDVFHPNKVMLSAQCLLAQPLVADGQQQVLLEMSGLGTNDTIGLTIDVDDTSGTGALTGAMDAQAQITLTTPRGGAKGPRAV